MIPIGSGRRSEDPGGHCALQREPDLWLSREEVFARYRAQGLFTEDDLAQARADACLESAPVGVSSVQPAVTG